MRSQRDRVLSPWRQSEQSAYPNPTEPGGVTALRAIEPPVKVAFRSGRMQLLINPAIVSFLVNHQGFGAGLNDRSILGRLHWSDFDGNRGEKRPKLFDTFGQIVVTDKFWMLAGDKQ